jgi:uncharacterized membrane protein required for colicin V production
MRTITVDYAVLMWMIIILFGMVGYFRGWWKEGLTTGFLTLLIVLLKFPGLAEMIVNFLNKLIKLVYIAIKAHSLDIERLAEVAKEITDIPIKIDPTDFRVYIFGLIGTLVVSYIIGKMSVNNKVIGPTFLGSVLGAIFGLLNGFTVISLVREYVLGRYLPGVTAQAAAQAATITSISLAVEDLPTPTVVEGWVPWLIVAIGALLLFAVLATRWSVERATIKGVVPPLYKWEKAPEKKPDLVIDVKPAK